MGTIKPTDIISVEGRRSDGRSLEEFRPAFLNAGSHSKANGSAYAEFGSTKVLVGVFGPREAESRQGFSQGGSVHCDVKHISSSTSVNANKQVQTEKEREDASILQQALEGAINLEAYPKSVVDIFCVVLESGGSDLSILISATSLAIADAGIPMFDLVSSCYISRLAGQLVLDPSNTELEREDGGCLVSMMSQQNKITHFLVTGEWTMSQLTALMELGIGACNQLDHTLRQNLLASSE